MPTCSGHPNKSAGQSSWNDASMQTVFMLDQVNTPGVPHHHLIVFIEKRFTSCVTPAANLSRRKCLGKHIGVFCANHRCLLSQVIRFSQLWQQACFPFNLWLQMAFDLSMPHNSKGHHKMALEPGPWLPRNSPTLLEVHEIIMYCTMPSFVVRNRLH